MSHTPGPWRHEREDSQTRYGFTVRAGDGREFNHVADCNGMSPEVEANARLIAAVPDLLDACELAPELRRICEEIGYHGDMSDATDPDTIAWRDGMHAHRDRLLAVFTDAIAKAKGGKD